MTDTHMTAGIPPTPPPVLRGQELYDLIMGQIEPDLLSVNVDGLAARYVQQTPEERSERAQRYRNAFSEYERRLTEYQRQWDEQLRTYKRLAIAYIEHQAQSGEVTDLQSIESSLLA
jgi:hypothetical protein